MEVSGFLMVRFVVDLVCVKCGVTLKTLWRCMDCKDLLCECCMLEHPHGLRSEEVIPDVAT